MFLTLNWCLASEYASLALTWQRTNSSQLTRERSRVHRRWASCLRSKVTSNLYCYCSICRDETCPNEPHLLNKYKINKGFSYFNGIRISSVINILTPYKMNKYYHVLHLASLFISYMPFILFRVCVNDIMLYELCIWTKFPAFSRWRLWCVHYTGGNPLRHVMQHLLRFLLDGWSWITYFFACLIWDHAKCYMVFLGMTRMEVLLLYNWHANMGRMGTTKICI